MLDLVGGIEGDVTAAGELEVDTAHDRVIVTIGAWDIPCLARSCPAHERFPGVAVVLAENRADMTE